MKETNEVPTSEWIDLSDKRAKIKVGELKMRSDGIPIVPQRLYSIERDKTRFRSHKNIDEFLGKEPKMDSSVYLLLRVLGRHIKMLESKFLDYNYPIANLNEAPPKDGFLYP